MAEAKKEQVVVYTGTKLGKSDVRVIDKLRWDASNDWTVPAKDVPAEIMKEIKEGSLKSEFNLVEQEAS